MLPIIWLSMHFCAFPWYTSSRFNQTTWWSPLSLCHYGISPTISSPLTEPPPRTCPRDAWTTCLTPFSAAITRHRLIPLLRPVPMPRDSRSSIPIPYTCLFSSPIGPYHPCISLFTCSLSLSASRCISQYRTWISSHILSSLNTSYHASNPQILC